MKYLVTVMLVIAFGFVLPVTAQDADPAQQALKYAEAQEKNLEALQTYSWKTRTEIAVNETPTAIVDGRSLGTIRHAYDSRR